MPIYIAKTYNEFTENIVMARSRELAVVYWQGKGIYPHSIEERSESQMVDHPTGVMPILNTHKENLPPFGLSARECILVSK